MIANSGYYPEQAQRFRSAPEEPWTSPSHSDPGAGRTAPAAAPGGGLADSRQPARRRGLSASSGPVAAWGRRTTQSPGPVMIEWSAIARCQGSASRAAVRMPDPITLDAQSGGTLTPRIGTP